MKENILVKITDKGVVISSEMTVNFLLQLIAYKKHYPLATVDEIIEKGIKQLEKEILWLSDKILDNTISKEIKQSSYEQALEGLEYIKELWNKKDI